MFALQRLKKGYVQRFSTFQTRKGLHDLLLLHTKVLSENKVKSPCFLTVSVTLFQLVDKTVLHNGAGGMPLHFGDHTNDFYQKLSRAATPMPMTVVPCRHRKPTLITKRNSPKGMLKMT